MFGTKTQLDQNSSTLTALNVAPLKKRLVASLTVHADVRRVQVVEVGAGARAAGGQRPMALGPNMFALEVAADVMGFVWVVMERIHTSIV